MISKQKNQRSFQAGVSPVAHRSLLDRYLWTDLCRSRRIDIHECSGPVRVIDSFAGLVQTRSKAATCAGACSNLEGALDRLPPESVTNDEKECLNRASASCGQWWSLQTASSSLFPFIGLCKQWLLHKKLFFKTTPLFELCRHQMYFNIQA
jgi:hypothetical protein